MKNASEMHDGGVDAVEYVEHVGKVRTVIRRAVVEHGAAALGRWRRRAFIIVGKGLIHGGPRDTWRPHSTYTRMPCTT